MKLFFLFFTLCFAFQLSAQALSADEKIDAVYAPPFFTNNAELRAAFTRLINERITYMRSPYQADEKYTLLSTCPLNDKDDPRMTRDTRFDADTFNPLKYKMNFFARTTQVYRFDGSDYLIIITPQ